MSVARNIYRVARSVLFSAIALVGVIYIGLYVALSIPAVQDDIRDTVQRELTKFLGSDVRIGSVEIHPFNEAIVRDLVVRDRSGLVCLHVEKVGAGINIGRLITEKRIELTYAELIGLDVSVRQRSENAPLNIQFIIDAFKPKRQGQPPTKFDLMLHSVVIRRARASFDREWKPRKASGQFDINHIRVYDLKADVDLPRLKNDDFIIDLRRLALKAGEGDSFSLDRLSAVAHLTDTSLSFNNLIVRLPDTDIRPADFSLKFPSMSRIGEAVRRGSHQIVIVDSRVNPSDFAYFLPQLDNFNLPFLLSASLEGNTDAVSVSELSLSTADSRQLSLKLAGDVSSLSDPKGIRVDMQTLSLRAGSGFMSRIADGLPGLKVKVADILRRLGDVSLDAVGSLDLAGAEASADLQAETAAGKVSLTAGLSGFGRERPLTLAGEVAVEDLDLGLILDDAQFGHASLRTDCDLRIAGKDTEGRLTADIALAEFRGMSLSDISVEATRHGRDASMTFSADDPNLSADINATALLDGVASSLNLDADIRHFDPSAFGLISKYQGYVASVEIHSELTGNTPDNLVGNITVTDLNFAGPQKLLYLHNLDVESGIDEGSRRTISLRSDLLTGNVTGNFRFRDIPAAAMSLVSQVVPSFVAPHTQKVPEDFNLDFDFRLHPDDEVAGFFNLPVRLLTEVPLRGSMTGTGASLTFDVPYLQQGRDKLVRDTRLEADLTAEGGASLRLHTVYPAKKGDADLSLLLTAAADNVVADMDISLHTPQPLTGTLSLEAALSRRAGERIPSVDLRILPTAFKLGATEWNIGDCRLTYDTDHIDISRFHIWHDRQFVSVTGTASKSHSDIVEVSLADIDVGYIFDILNIDYVTFGGIATGEVMASGVFSGSPVAKTRKLLVKDLAYNGSVLGDGDLSSQWINSEKEVEINADITDKGRPCASIRGGVWVGCDSLNFKLDADKVNIGFLQPFMSAFSSDVGGRASGQANLYGNFHDIDLAGRLFADSIRMKVDYTGVYYSGSDSVIIDPGHIRIPDFKLRDRYGNTAILNGELKHRFFHDPSFTFRIRDARNLLCYDTSAADNPLWYGTIFGNGGGTVRGWPGMVTIDVDMATARNSKFTFVLSDTQDAADYHFLTFSDRRKEARLSEQPDTVPEFLKTFYKRVEKQKDRPTAFAMNLWVSVTPDALLTLVMDPEAGDKITARGSGPMQIGYSSETDAMTMYGKYTLDEGSYNFTLQELIIRDFTIRPGSSISFNGNPMAADLDIAATYRVNTNLSDLDKSFSTDRDLNRTNVPVDALLYVKGDMEHPDITFDIELPTLTSDTERKVKSIISTDDMMNRQIIYLLALNRFYTPEYMGGGSNGSGELTSVASSTISSQLSRMMGQLTDKFTLSPSFRSDKGDFSDFEMDLALSSRLLDNRLLINGNFGYRDKSTSSTTLVGDFDIEYLLSKNGNLRLKAYNHFNDQNYYLKSSLTTQGIGVIYRRDFDNPFTFLKRRKKKRPVASESDTVKHRPEKTANDM